ncbi:MAG: helicase-related protein [Vicinamibacterales bacterium]
MRERSQTIDWIRGELVGPSRPLTDPTLVEIVDKVFIDPERLRNGPVGWRPEPEGQVEEILYFQRETAHRKYGAGLLHPGPAVQLPAPPSDQAVQASDTLGIEADTNEFEDEVVVEEVTEQAGADGDLADSSDEFEVTSPDIRHPSTLGVSFCVRLGPDDGILVNLPRARRFTWQTAESLDFPLNGRYEACTRRWTDDAGLVKEAPIWRRLPAVLPGTSVAINRHDLANGQVVRRDITMPDGSPISLRVEVFPRQVSGQQNVWLLTVVLRNSSLATQAPHEATLYQTYFEVRPLRGEFQKYPESQRPFGELDPEEQSLTLLYRESATWGIGHGCAAGWDTEPGQSPEVIYADVMPAVQLPSMTPDISDDDGTQIQLSMRALADLPDGGNGAAWDTLERVAEAYRQWINRQQLEVVGLPEHLRPVASRHIDGAQACLARIRGGITLLRSDERVRRAFRLANLAMLLQQIATKQLNRRGLRWDHTRGVPVPDGAHRSPWDVLSQNQAKPELGSWRAFQIAFLLMSLAGTSTDDSADREVVDLIWFPTGGGKTEAYLGVMAFYMFHQRLLTGAGELPARDGTNVLMRYTLRMLTTQQFQRAASLICAMEFLRRQPGQHGIADIAGRRFSLGLWIGGSGSPNKIAQARTDLGAYRQDRISGNPLVLTECPWCRSEIGRFDGAKPAGVAQGQWRALRVRGIQDHAAEGPLLLCSDRHCTYGGEHWQEWLPVEVIDERIYNNPPSLVIATADKFAMVAFRPDAGAIFGRGFLAGESRQLNRPPGLIIQDELHLISGPLGTVYGLYEGVFERLCSVRANGSWIKPKLIASTATIRGAADQTLALFARPHTQLFPSPGLLMGDSFFGKYARDADGRLLPGRLYLGIHANDYGSVLTTQVRAFSSALFRPHTFDQAHRDPWWSLLVFYNSIRELGGAKTLFDSDIRSRLKFIFNRENFGPQDRRNLRIVEELTSRLSQAEIVGMMDRLATPYAEVENKALDVCLASNIIEVGVDIDRLSLMGVVGQPKTTAQYIQVTGRVGRKWWERAGLIVTIYNPSKSRDRSHFEQFHSYHRRLYERVEPTSATPFALSAIQRALPGALIAWARQHSNASVRNYAAYDSALESGYALLRQRCELVQSAEDQGRSLQELERVSQELQTKWGQNPQEWEAFPPSVNGEYLMLWPGQFSTLVQKQRGVLVPSSMRQVDGSAELTITQGYSVVAPPANPQV